MNYQNDDLRIKEIKELLPPVGGVVLFAAGTFPSDRKHYFRPFFNLLIIHIKIIGTPFANNQTSLPGVVHD